MKPVCPLFSRAFRRRIRSRSTLMATLRGIKHERFYISLNDNNIDDIMNYLLMSYDLGDIWTYRGDTSRWAGQPVCTSTTASGESLLLDWFIHTTKPGYSILSHGVFADDGQTKISVYRRQMCQSQHAEGQPVCGPPPRLRQADIEDRARLKCEQWASSLTEDFFLRSFRLVTVCDWSWVTPPAVRSPDIIVP
jgi:hypothetical protein